MLNCRSRRIICCQLFLEASQDLNHQGFCRSNIQSYMFLQLHAILLLAFIGLQLSVMQRKTLAGKKTPVIS